MIPEAEGVTTRRWRIGLQASGCPTRYVREPLKLDMNRGPLSFKPRAGRSGHDDLRLTRVASVTSVTRAISAPTRC